MLAKVYSAAILGIDAYLVDVEVDLFNGIPGISMVGLPGAAVQESKERVKSAIKNSSLVFPIKKMTINMAPANKRKSGPVFDLAIAMGILAASEQIPETHLENSLFIGELSLDGKIRSVKGVLPIAIAAHKSGKKNIFVPIQNATEAALIKGLKVHPVSHLKEVVQLLSYQLLPHSFIPKPRKKTHSSKLNYADVKGQNHAKRGLEIAAAGNHNLLMIGPPGSGKTMLARRFPSILPALNTQEALESTRIYSISEDRTLQGLIKHPPFRAPHHSITPVGLIGGSKYPKPGEITLAHNGVLFLDELLEFKKHVLELLRQPLEDHFVSISRAQSHLTYPAKFMLIGAMNPCPCGYWGDPQHTCHCSPLKIKHYWNKVSGPFIDRVDLHLELPRLNQAELLSESRAESSGDIYKRVLKARSIQTKRFAQTDQTSNSEMLPIQMKQFCKLDLDTKKIIGKAIQNQYLSARSYDRILKVARTIADLDNSSNIKIQHLAEAIQFRTLDRALPQSA